MLDILQQCDDKNLAQRLLIQEDAKGETVLLMAISKSTREEKALVLPIITRLLEFVDPRIPSAGGYTALMHAAYCLQVEIVEMLLEKVEQISQLQIDEGSSSASSNASIINENEALKKETQKSEHTASVTFDPSRHALVCKSSR